MNNLKKIITALIIVLSVSCSNKKLDWVENAVLYEVNLRQYTKEGTIKAFIEHLPRLSNLGVDILWLMPIHPISKKNRNGGLGSYYSVSDYTMVNPEFGTYEDFKLLVEKSHELGLKILLDWVPNHTGWDHKWITLHPDWYTQINGEIIFPVGTGWKDVADLNFSNKAMKEEMINNMSYWVKEFDIDGFRCDAAGMVPDDFWEEAIKSLNKTKTLYFLAENSDNPQLLNLGFKSNYNWSLMSSMEKTADKKLKGSSLFNDLKRSGLTMPEGCFPLNFVTNHDENSWNGTMIERFGQYRDLVTALSFIAPGMPLIYSGQEASLDKRLLFFDKDLIEWGHFEYQNFLKKLIIIKKNNSALKNTSLKDIVRVKTDNRDILAFTRGDVGQRVMFIGNFSSGVVNITYKGDDNSSLFTPVFNNGTEIKLSNGEKIKLDPFGFNVYIEKQ